MARKTYPMVTYGRTYSEALGSSPELLLEVLDASGMPMLLLERRGGNPYHDKRGRFTSKGGVGKKVMDVIGEADADFAEEELDDDIEGLLDELTNLGHIDELQVTQARIYGAMRPSLDERAEPRGTTFGDSSSRTANNTVSLVEGKEQVTRSAADALGIPLEEFASYFDSKSLEQNRIDTEFEMVRFSGGGVAVNATLKIGNSKVGSMWRTIDPKTGEVGHESFKLDPDFQATGIGKELFRSHLGIYERIDAKSVELLANVTVGGYAWARYGFDAKESVVDKYRAKLAREAEMKGASEQEKLMIESIEHMWEIAAFRSSNQKVSGKSVLMGTSWPGTLDLAEGSPSNVQMRRYLSMGKS